MNGLERLRQCLSEYHSKWRNPSLPPLEVSKVFDFDRDYEEYYPYADRPGCYVFFGECFEISYVGKAVILGNRFGSYLRRDKPNRKLKVLYDWKVMPRYAVCIAVQEAFEAPSLEEFLISQLDPPDNTRGKMFTQ